MVPNCFLNNAFRSYLSYQSLGQRVGGGFNSPMRRVNEVFRPRILWPHRTKLVGHRTHHSHLAATFALPDTSVPFFDEGKVAVLVKVDLLAVPIFRKVIVLERDAFFLLTTPPPHAFLLPYTLLRLPCTCSRSVCENLRSLTGRKWERSGVDWDLGRVAGAQGE